MRKALRKALEPQAGAEGDLRDGVDDSKSELCKLPDSTALARHLAVYYAVTYPYELAGDEILLQDLRNGHCHGHH